MNKILKVMLLTLALTVSTTIVGQATTTVKEVNANEATISQGEEVEESSSFNSESGPKPEEGMSSRLILDESQFTLIEESNYVDYLYDSWNTRQSLFYHNIIKDPYYPDYLKVQLTVISDYSILKDDNYTAEIFKKGYNGDMQWQGNIEFYTAGYNTMNFGLLLDEYDYIDDEYIYIRFGISQSSYDDYYSDVTCMKVKNPYYSKGNWVSKNGNWYYQDRNGNNIKGWVEIDGIYYYLDPSTGIMKTGWLNINGTYYYLNNNGSMATGWIKLNGSYYYLYGSGAMATGWINLDGIYYYLNNSGSMATGWVNLNGTYYYLYGSGAMATGWLNLNGTYYYLHNSGDMVTGWLNLNGTYYYLDGSGAMKTGWNVINGQWYYLYNSGEMASNTIIDGWKIAANGVATQI